jgi:arylsulfatase A-like enzyme
VYNFENNTVNTGAIRVGDYKLVATDRDVGLYSVFNLMDDPGETVDLKADLQLSNELLSIYDVNQKL